MLVWNKKDSVLQAAKTKGLFFQYGDEIPEDEIAPGRKERLLAAGWLIVKKAKAPKEEAPKSAYRAKPLPLPEKQESKPKKKKGRR